MIVAKYANELYLLQPITEISLIEKHRPKGRNPKQSGQNETFASLFQKAARRQEQLKKLSNGFDMFC